MGSAPALLLDEVQIARQGLRPQGELVSRIEHEFGVLHSKRIKDRAFHEMIERFARGDLDHAAKYIG